MPSAVDIIPVLQLRQNQLYRIAAVSRSSIFSLSLLSFIWLRSQSVVMADEWQKHLSFSDRLAETSKMQVSVQS
jgi:hypothetical protein